jgi:hypothetical protein
MIHAHVGLTIAAIVCAMVTAGLAYGSWPLGRALPRCLGLAAIGVKSLTVAVLIAAWALPVAEQLANTPGNMRKIVEFFLFQDSPRPSIAVSVRGYVGSAVQTRTDNSAFRPGFRRPVANGDMRWQ